MLAAYNWGIHISPKPGLWPIQCKTTWETSLLKLNSPRDMLVLYNYNYNISSSCVSYAYQKPILNALSSANLEVLVPCMCRPSILAPESQTHRVFPCMYMWDSADLRLCVSSACGYPPRSSYWRDCRFVTIQICNLCSLQIYRAAGPHRHAWSRSRSVSDLHRKILLWSAS